MNEFKRDWCNLRQMDCMNLLRETPDGFYDLAIVDPEYGIGEDGKKNHSRSKLAKATKYKDKNWDIKIPPKEYFTELKRASKNQIIWGANHLIQNIPDANSSSWLVWDKDNGSNDFSDCELAYTSFKTAVRKFKFRWAGMLQGDMKNKEKRIHPTQKPVQLYKWILKNYAKPNDKILDTHLGSGSIVLAVNDVNKKDNMNLHITGTELDTDYFSDMVKRIEQNTLQMSIFE